MTEPELQVPISSVLEYKIIIEIAAVVNMNNLAGRLVYTIMMWEIFMQQYSNTLELCMFWQLYAWYSQQ